MKNFKKQLQELNKVIIVSFLISSIVGFIAGGLASQWLGAQPEKIEQSGFDKESSAVKIEKQEEAVVEAVKIASPAVVSVIVSKDLPVLEKYYEEQSPFGKDDFFRRFFGDDFFSPFQIPQYREKGTEKREIGGGTGFVVSKDGMVVTNRHVVSDTKATYTAFTNDGKKYDVEVAAVDPTLDIAILKLKGAKDILELGFKESSPTLLCSS